MSSSPILYAEDETDDAFFMRRALRQAGVDNPLLVVLDGQQVIDYLAGEGAFANRTEYPMPCLVLLDLNLPVKNGLEVLAWKAARPELASVPVVVVTSSTQRNDFEQATKLGASECIVKPVNPNDLAEEISALKEQWLTPSKA